MNEQNDFSFDKFLNDLFDKLPDINTVKLWKLIVITVILPPIGTYLLAIRKDIPLWIKIIAAIYTAALLIFLLSNESACRSTAVISASDIIM